MDIRDKERLALSSAVATVVYAVLFLFLNPLEWLGNMGFREPIGPLTVQLDAAPVVTSEYRQVQKEPEKPPEPVEPPETVKPPEPQRTPAPASRTPAPPASVQSAPQVPSFELKRSVEDLTDSPVAGTPIRTATGGTVSTAPPSPDPSETRTGGPTSESSVEYAPVQAPPRESVQPVTAAPESRILSEDALGSVDAALSSPQTAPRTDVPRTESQTRPFQTDVPIDLEDLKARRDIRLFVEPEIPSSVQRAGVKSYEVLVTFDLLDSGIVTNVIISRGTDIGEFDGNIRTAITRWRFVPVGESSGSVRVTLRYVITVE